MPLGIFFFINYVAFGSETSYITRRKATKERNHAMSKPDKKQRKAYNLHIALCERTSEEYAGKAISGKKLLKKANPEKYIVGYTGTATYLTCSECGRHPEIKTGVAFTEDSGISLLLTCPHCGLSIHLSPHNGALANRLFPVDFEALKNQKTFIDGDLLEPESKTIGNKANGGTIKTKDTRTKTDPNDDDEEKQAIKICSTEDIPDSIKDIVQKIVQSSGDDTCAGCIVIRVRE